IALVYRSRKPKEASETHTPQSNVAQIAVADLARNKGGAVLLRRPRMDRAGTAPAAVVNQKDHKICAAATVEQLRKKSSRGSITSRSQSRLICRLVTISRRVRRC